jgi:hypothetical protein
VGEHDAGLVGIASDAVFQIGAGGRTDKPPVTAEASELPTERAPAAAEAATTAATRKVRPSARVIPYPP